MKKVIIPALLLALSLPATAQHLGNPDVPFTFSDMIGSLGDTLLYIILGIAVLMLFLVLVVYLSVTRLRDQILAENNPEYAAKASQSLWGRIFQVSHTATDKAKMLDHNYDDIQELDNPIPSWFMWLFYITVAFGVVYTLNYHIIGSGKLQEEEYIAKMEQAEVEKAAYLKKVGDKINAETVTLLTDKESLEKGKELYLAPASCASCHVDDGGGNVGPNLTDEYWKHGGGIKNVFKSIVEGYPNAGMKSWKKDFSNVEIQQIASYVISLQGSKPANPKEPEGEKWTEGEESKPSPTETTDSTKVELSMK